jgi:hypothetical protein
VCDTADRTGTHDTVVSFIGAASIPPLLLAWFVVFVWLKVLLLDAVVVAIAVVVRAVLVVVVDAGWIVGSWRRDQEQS